jgi:Pentapeptide repeats (8 copies)/TIR domain
MCGAPSGWLLGPPAKGVKRIIICGAKLKEANLSRSNLSGTNLSSSDLSGANLNTAELAGANLRWAILRGASLKHAGLVCANLTSARLEEVDFTNALVSETDFSGVDLSAAKGLETINHVGPSTIGIDTVYKSQGKIPEVFLRGCGVPDDLIAYIKSIAGAIQFYSCFISYSSKDQEFAERLHADLQAKGVRCWFAPEE